MMNVKKVIKVLSLSFLMSFGLFSAVRADTILFPVIAINQPNVTTLVSVVNFPHPSGTSYLHYIYRHKATGNIGATCSKTEFTRSTTDSDLVSFDASGVIGGGNALFGDTNSYGGSFYLPGSGARRAYLLVTNSDASGTRVNSTTDTDLMGEAIIMDIAYGAAWGMRAINDNTSQTYNFVNAEDGGGVWSALPSNAYMDRTFAFFPPDEWTTKFFITPIGNNMDSDDLNATVTLSGNNVFDRNGINHTSVSVSQSITCTGVVTVSDLMDSSIYSAVENIGGWGWFQVSSGDAIVYKLEYVVDNATYGGTNNNGYLLSSYGLP